MKKIIGIFTVIMLILFIAGCSCTKSKSNMNTSDGYKKSQVQYIPVRNYFVNNGITTPDYKDTFVITSQEDFDKYFSPAAFMGKDGESTKTDFDKYVALCIVSAETDIDRRLSVVDIQEEKDGSITMSYRLTVGNKMSYTIRPCLIVLVDRHYLSRGIRFHKVFVR